MLVNIQTDRHTHTCTSISSRARARRASLASKDSRTDTSSSFAFSSDDFKRFNFAGLSPRTGSPSTSVSIDSAASNSAFAFAATSSADTMFFFRDDISFLRSQIRLYVLLTAFLRIYIYALRDKRDKKDETRIKQNRKRRKKRAKQKTKCKDIIDASKIGTKNNRVKD